MPLACPMTSRASSACGARRRLRGRIRAVAHRRAPTRRVPRTRCRMRGGFIERTRTIAVKVERSERVFGGEQAEREHAVDPGVDGSRRERRPHREVVAQIGRLERWLLGDRVQAWAFADLTFHFLDLADQRIRPRTGHDPPVSHEEDAGFVAPVDLVDREDLRSVARSARRSARPKPLSRCRRKTRPSNQSADSIGRHHEPIFVDYRSGR